MQLTPHFSLAELTRSATAQRLGLDNTPHPDDLPRLQQLAEMLERIRSTLGHPITITSGYRCREVNQAVGGVTSSDHTRGQAADMVCPQFGTPHAVAKTLAPLVDVLRIGQIALEGIGGKHWLHVSTRTPARAADRVITITAAGTMLGIRELS